ncbi:MAG: hypothetical protein ACTSO9_07965 [Candidatus Helarchaeota archaeon]
MVKEKVQTLLLQCVYPEIVSFLKKNMETEDLIQILRDVGTTCAKTIAEYWRPGGKTVQDMIKNIFSFIFDNKSVKIIKTESGKLRLIDQECRLCWENLEEQDINYCFTISSFIEELINSTRESYVFLPKIKVNTIKSKATGAEHCEHIVEFI